MSIKLAGKLPKQEANGVAALAGALEENPTQRVLVVGVLAVSKHVADYDHPEDPSVTHVRLVSIEPMQAGTKDAETVQRVLAKAFSGRTGIQELPWEDDGA